MAVKRKETSDQNGHAKDTARPDKRPRASALVQEEEPAFPRGGGGVLTPLEYRQINARAKEDVLFEQRTGKSRTTDFDSDSEAEYDAEGNGEKPAKPASNTLKAKKARQRQQEKTRPKYEPTLRIEGLSYNRLTEGTLILGCVSRITRYEATVDLPNNLQGFLPITSVSKRVTSRLEELAEKDDDEMEVDEEKEVDEDLTMDTSFSIGQWIVVCVKKTKEEAKGQEQARKRIELSTMVQDTNQNLKVTDLEPNLFLQAEITSVEDRGAILDLGLEEDSSRGFIPASELQDSPLKEGHVLQCLVVKRNSSGKTVRLTSQKSVISDRGKSLLKDTPNIDALRPGTLVEVVVEQASDSGISGKIMGLLDATIDHVHSRQLAKLPSVGNKIKARILFTCPGSDPRKIAVSLAPEIMGLSVPHHDSNVLSSTAEATVTKVQASSGLYLTIKGLPSQLVFVHISQVSDDRIESLEGTSGKFKIGSEHKVRVLGFNSADGLYLGSMQSRTLSQKYLRVEDVKEGDLVDASVEKFLITSKGKAAVILKVEDTLSGFVDELHLSDVSLKNPERRFREGTKVKARVLSLDLERRRLFLMLKKSLVNSDDPIWSSWSDLEVGAETPGTVVALLDSGAIVQFYGNVKGFLPKGEMSESFVKDTALHFKLGQVVKVHILSVDPEGERMTLSCRNKDSFGASQQAAFAVLQVGTLVDGVVAEKTDDELVIELPSGLRGELPLGHISDGSTSKNESLVKRIRVGQDLSSLLVMSKNLQRRTVLLSLSPKLQRAAKEGSIPASLSDLVKGKEVVGFVASTTPDAVFVHFFNSLAGILSKSQLESTETTVRLHQTITARVASIDVQQERFSLTQKFVETPANSAPILRATNDGLARKVDNAFDGKSKSMKDFSIGKVTKAKIIAVKNSQLNIKLADGVQGRVDVCQAFDSIDEIKDTKHPFKHMKMSDIIPVRLLGLHDYRSHRFLPISHVGKNPVFECTIRPSDLESDSLNILTLDKMVVGNPYLCFVNNITSEGLWVNVTPNIRGRIRSTDVSDDASLATDLHRNFPVGSALVAKLTKLDVDENKIDFSARSEQDSTGDLSLDSLTVGEVVPARVTKVSDRQVVVQLGEGLAGPIHLTDLADDYDKVDPSSFYKNQVLSVCVTGVDLPNKRMHLSCRPSLVQEDFEKPKDPDFKSAAELQVNQIVRGFIKNVTDQGLFVALSGHVTAFVRVSDLSDKFIKDWKANFEIDTIVKGKVISKDSSSNRVSLSFKESVLSSDYKPPIKHSDLQVGQIVTGKVRKVEDFGVFILLDNSENVSGLCHRSEMADHRIGDVKALYSEGDRVKAKILKVDPKNHRVSLGLKASYFAAEEDNEDDEDSEGGVNISEDESEDEGSTANGNALIPDMGGLQDNDSDEESSSQHPDGLKLGPGAGAFNGLGDSSTEGLSTGGFNWNAGLAGFEAQDDLSSDSGDQTEEKKPRKKKPQVYEDLTGQMDVDGPKSVADFERNLLGQPNSSILWLSYMAFYLQQDEIDQARAIAERALKTISHQDKRVEEEALNVWVGLLNLENAYGDDDSIDEVFRRACEYNDVEEIHARLGSIYIQSGKLEKADAIFQTMIKKFSQNPKIWLNYATFLFDSNSPQRARDLLPRALQSLPKHHHLDLTSKFGQLEFRSTNGDSERGRTIFEGLLDTFPKRYDLWNVLLDLETRIGDKDVIRNLYARVTALPKLKPKHAKFFFKRWIEWEAKNGTAKTVEKVNAQAAEYVKAHAKE